VAYGTARKDDVPGGCRQRRWKQLVIHKVGDDMRRQDGPFVLVGNVFGDKLRPNYPPRPLVP